MSRENLSTWWWAKSDYFRIQNRNLVWSLFTGATTTHRKEACDLAAQQLAESQRANLRRCPTPDRRLWLAGTVLMRQTLPWMELTPDPNAGEYICKVNEGSDCVRLVVSGNWVEFPFWANYPFKTVAQTQLLWLCALLLIQFVVNEGRARDGAIYHPHKQTGFDK